VLGLSDGPRVSRRIQGSDVCLFCVEQLLSLVLFGFAVYLWFYSVLLYFFFFPKQKTKKIQQNRIEPKITLLSLVLFGFAVFFLFFVLATAYRGIRGFVLCLFLVALMLMCCDVDVL